MLGALLALAASARAAVVLDGASEVAVALPAGQAGDASALAPFHLEAAGSFYAKVLPAPWNPVNPGQPNGTVSADHAAGLTGWWVRFRLADANGKVLDDLGAFVDSTPTRLVALAPGQPAHLRVEVHAPAEAALAGMAYRVPVALAFRAAGAGSNGSGGSLDPSRGVTLELSFLAASSGGGGGAPPVPLPSPPAGTPPSPPGSPPAAPPPSGGSPPASPPAPPPPPPASPPSSGSGQVGTPAGSAPGGAAPLGPGEDPGQAAGGALFGLRSDWAPFAAALSFATAALVAGGLLLLRLARRGPPPASP